jgi:hypothetical protein
MLPITATETEVWKSVRSPSYNFRFNQKDGTFARWGRCLEDNAIFAPTCPELLDVEISINGCTGTGKGACRWCYKGNTAVAPTNMTLATFQTILDKLPRITGVIPVTQIAFGITNIKSNPDFLDILKLTRSYGIVPNFTCTGVDLEDDWLQEAAKVIGAVAVSCYQTDKELCYGTIKRFQQAGVKQTNMHLLYHQNNLPFVYEVLDDIVQGVVKPNACILLGLKPKNRGRSMSPLDSVNFGKLAEYAMLHKIPLGFDSCSAPKFSKWLAQNDTPNKVALEQQVEPCESGIFSLYLDVHGNAWPCSFCEDEVGITPINMLETNDFTADVWLHPAMVAFRERNIANQRACIVFPEIDN